MIILSILHIAIELQQIYQTGSDYFLDWENYLQLFVFLEQSHLLHILDSAATARLNHNGCWGLLFSFVHGLTLSSCWRMLQKLEHLSTFYLAYVISI